MIMTGLKFAVVLPALLMMLTWLARVHATVDETTLYVTLSTAVGAPEAAQCSQECVICKSKILTCPKQCPSRSLVAAGISACFIDCSAKCQATCKHRNPQCWGYGAVCYDPRFVGGDGIMFYFHGKADQDFCIVSDKNLHINAHFIGKRPEGRTRDYTWVQALGMLYDSHKISVASKKVAQWDDSVDQLSLTYDGEPILLEQISLASWTSPSGEMKVERVAAANSVEIKVNGLLTLIVKVRPITEKENKMHNYQIPADDCFAHLDLQFRFFNLSSRVDGVLGQTYQPNFKNPVKIGVPMPIMGGDDKFLSSSLLSHDCKKNKFFSSSDEAAINMAVAEEIPQQNNNYNVFAAHCRSNKGGSGIVCRR